MSYFVSSSWRLYSILYNGMNDLSFLRIWPTHFCVTPRRRSLGRTNKRTDGNPASATRRAILSHLSLSVVLLVPHHRMLTPTTPPIRICVADSIATVRMDSCCLTTSQSASVLAILMASLTPGNTAPLYQFNELGASRTFLKMDKNRGKVFHYHS